MSQPQALYRLQEADMGILRAQQRLKQIADLLANDETLQQAQAQVAAAHKQLSPLKARLRNLEHEIQSNELKTRTAEQQLYSGAIKNPKEMQDVQQEIESLKRWHSELENTLLETMLVAEEAEAALGQSEEHLAAVVSSRSDEHQRLLGEQSQSQASLEEFKLRRQQVLTEIAPENLKIYTTMRARKNHQPVALMQGNICSVCGVAQTVAIEREVRQGIKLVTCSNCERILVSG